MYEYLINFQILKKVSEYRLNYLLFNVVIQLIPKYWDSVGEYCREITLTYLIYSLYYSDSICRHMGITNTATHYHYQQKREREKRKKQCEYCMRQNDQ